MKYIDQKYILRDFFKIINKAEINYVVLRWFSNFQCLSSQKDIDILVADKDLENIENFCTSSQEKGWKRIDVYSPLSRNGFNRLSYYPRHLAERILDSKLLNNDYVYVPSPGIYLLSFIFHVVFHKAEQSNIPVISSRKVETSKSNKYLIEILRAADEAGLSLPDPINLENLLELLRNFGWCPSIEWTRRIAHNRSRWLSSLYPPTVGSVSRSVFLIRDKGKQPSVHRHLIRLFAEERVELVCSCILNREQVKRASLLIRNGIWDKGPFQLNGGKPFRAYILQNHFRLLPSTNSKEKYPYVIDEKFLLIKKRIRELIKELLNEKALVNCVHSSDDELEAREYLSVLFAEESNTESEEMKVCLNKAFSFKVVETFIGNSKRAELVRIRANNYYEGICKTFLEGHEKNFQRELSAYCFLSNKATFVPRFFCCSRNEIFIEYINANEKFKDQELKTRLADIAQIVYFFWKNGCAHLDMHPDNFLIALDGKLYLIDYEFFYFYEKRPDSVLDSYDLKGFPEPKLLGLRGKNPSDYINNLWKQKVGLTLFEIVEKYLKFLPV